MCWRNRLNIKVGEARGREEKHPEAMVAKGEKNEVWE